MDFGLQFVLGEIILVQYKTISVIFFIKFSTCRAKNKNPAAANSSSKKN
jgi:hypothetical protein